MTSSEYTTRELNLHFAEIKETLARIEAQTIRTNGRVTKCEENINTVRTSGTVANWAFGLTIPLILGMGVWIFFNQLEDIRYDLEKHDREYQSLLDKIK